MRRLPRQEGLAPGNDRSGNQTRGPRESGRRVQHRSGAAQQDRGDKVQRDIGKAQLEFRAIIARRRFKVSAARGRARQWSPVVRGEQSAFGKSFLVVLLRGRIGAARSQQGTFPGRAY